MTVDEKAAIAKLGGRFDMFLEQYQKDQDRAEEHRKDLADAIQRVSADQARSADMIKDWRSRGLGALAVLSIMGAMMWEPFGAAFKAIAGAFSK